MDKEERMETQVMPSDLATCQERQPDILSMEVDNDDSFESEYRLRVGKQVKYLVISPGTFPRDTLLFPLESLHPLPYNEDWTVAHVSRDEASGDMKVSISTDHWLVSRTYGMIPGLPTAGEDQAAHGNGFQSRHIFYPSWDCPLIAHHFSLQNGPIRMGAAPHEQETRAYQLLDGSGLAPRFFGYIQENGRIMGFLVEKIEGRVASFHDLSICESALMKLHKLGLVHGDVNRYNFLTTNRDVKLLDFESLARMPAQSR